MIVISPEPLVANAVSWVWNSRLEFFKSTVATSLCGRATYISSWLIFCTIGVNAIIVDVISAAGRAPVVIPTTSVVASIVTSSPVFAISFTLYKVVVVKPTCWTASKESVLIPVRDLLLSDTLPVVVILNWSVSLNPGTGWPTKNTSP